MTHKDIGWFFAAIMVCSIVYMIGVINGFKNGIENTHQEAIKAGAGTYAITNHVDRVWIWNATRL